MATVGLSKPYYATYSETLGVVSYSDCTVLAKACEVDISLDNAEPIILYADNGPAESASSFGGGTLTLTIDELSLSVAADLFGLTTGSSSTPAGTTLTFSADTVAPYLGFGIVVKKINSGTTSYMGVILHKVQFQQPAISATTQGETIEFQTPELTATIMRDDSSNADWCTWGSFTSESDAESFVKKTLGYVAPTP